MRHLGFMLLGVIVTVTAIAVVNWGTKDSPPNPAVVSAPSASDEPALTDDAKRLSRMESNFAQLVSKVDSLTSRIDRLNSTSSRERASEPRVPIDERLVDNIIAKIEEKELDALSLDDLLQRAELVSDEDSDLARRMISNALHRSLTRAQRARVRLYLAEIYMTAGTSKEAEVIFEDLVQTEGVGSKAGASAALSLVNIKSDAGDHLGARRLAQTVASFVKLPREIRDGARYKAAREAARAGDGGQARAEAEQFLRELNGRERSSSFWVSQVKALIERIDK